MEKDAGNEKRQGKQDGRNAKSVAGAVYGVLMAGRVLRDPLLAGAVPEHDGIIHRPTVSLHGIPDRVAGPVEGKESSFARPTAEGGCPYTCSWVEASARRVVAS